MRIAGGKTAEQSPPRYRSKTPITARAQRGERNASILERVCLGKQISPCQKPFSKLLDRVMRQLVIDLWRCPIVNGFGHNIAGRHITIPIEMLRSNQTKPDGLQIIWFKLSSQDCVAQLYKMLWFHSKSRWSCLRCVATKKVAPSQQQRLKDQHVAQPRLFLRRSNL